MIKLLHTGFLAFDWSLPVVDPAPQSRISVMSNRQVDGGDMFPDRVENTASRCTLELQTAKCGTG